MTSCCRVHVLALSLVAADGWQGEGLSGWRFFCAEVEPHVTSVHLGLRIPNENCSVFHFLLQCVSYRLHFDASWRLKRLSVIHYVLELKWYQNKSVEEGGFGRVVGRNNP